MNVYSIPPIAITGYTTISGARSNSHSPLWDGSIRDNFSHLIGKHNLKAGTLYLRNRKNDRVGGTLVGNMSFGVSGNTNSTGNALLDTLLGNYLQYREGDNDKFSYTRYNQIEAYIADAWKERPNLTLDIGVRYTHLGAPYETGNTLATFVPNAFDSSKAQQVVPTGGTNQPVTANFYFDPTPGKILGVPAADHYGSSLPNVIQGQGRHNWDLSLFKNIKATERINLQFRAEAFNVWNHASFRNPNMNASSRDFGMISDAGYPRLIQFGFKLMF